MQGFSDHRTRRSQEKKEESPEYHPRNDRDSVAAKELHPFNGRETRPGGGSNRPRGRRVAVTRRSFARPVMLPLQMEVCQPLPGGASSALHHYHHPAGARALTDSSDTWLCVASDGDGVPPVVRATAAKYLRTGPAPAGRRPHSERAEIPRHRPRDGAPRHREDNQRLILLAPLLFSPSRRIIQVFQS